MSWVRNLFRSRYVAHLEAENKELRARLDALTNSMLATLGMPRMDIPASTGTFPDTSGVKRRSAPSLVRMRFEQASRPQPRKVKEDEPTNSKETP